MILHITDERSNPGRSPQIVRPQSSLGQNLKLSDPAPVLNPLNTRPLVEVTSSYSAPRTDQIPLVLFELGACKFLSPLIEFHLLVIAHEWRL